MHQYNNRQTSVDNHKSISMKGRTHREFDLCKRVGGPWCGASVV